MDGIIVNSFETLVYIFHICASSVFIFRAVGNVNYMSYTKAPPISSRTHYKFWTPLAPTLKNKVFPKCANYLKSGKPPNFCDNNKGREIAHNMKHAHVSIKIAALMVGSCNPVDPRFITSLRALRALFSA